MIALLLGGIGLFLLGMGLMTDGLKLAAGGGLERILARATGSPRRALAAGIAITALVQSSSAVTVATIGFVNAGLLNLAQSMWVTFGSNVGTTMTGWLVALVGVKVDVGALALPLLGGGMVLRLVAKHRVRLVGLGQAVAGFGALFLGISLLQEGFATLTITPEGLGVDQDHWSAVPLFIGLGMLLTVLAQSSSAAIAIVLTASAGGALPLALAGATVIGTNLGTTSTAVFASLGATPPAKRVAGAHIAFNLLTAGVAILLLPWLLAASAAALELVGHAGDLPAVLALFHTFFNCLGVLLMWPLAKRLERFLERRFVAPEEELGRPRHLDANLAGVPVLALRGLVAETLRLAELAFSTARVRIGGVGADDRELERREAGVLRLGLAIRTFIDHLNRQALPADVAEAIPDVIRGVQHLEDVAQISSELSADRPPPADPAAAAEIDALRQAALDAVVTAGAPPDAEPQPSNAEDRYQAAKTALLESAANGRLSVLALETILLDVRRLRRSADAATKARRRLGRWWKAYG